MKHEITLILCLVLFGNCSGDCQDDVAHYRLQQCSIIVEDMSIRDRWFSLEGKNVYTGKPDKYSDVGGWANIFKNKIEVGDTVIKQKNEMLFSVHKKDTTLAFPFDCQGKIYQ